MCGKIALPFSKLKIPSWCVARLLPHCSRFHPGVWQDCSPVAQDSILVCSKTSSFLLCSSVTQYSMSSKKIDLQLFTEFMQWRDGTRSETSELGTRNWNTATISGNLALGGGSGLEDISVNGVLDDPVPSDNVSGSSSASEASPGANNENYTADEYLAKRSKCKGSRSSAASKKLQVTKNVYSHC